MNTAEPTKHYPLQFVQTFHASKPMPDRTACLDALYAKEDCCHEPHWVSKAVECHPTAQDMSTSKPCQHVVQKFQRFGRVTPMEKERGLSRWRRRAARKMPDLKSFIAESFLADWGYFHLKGHGRQIGISIKEDIKRDDVPLNLAGQKKTE